MKHLPTQLIARYSRRESLQLLSVGTIASMAPVTFGIAASNTCLLTPELTVGPYYIDKEKVRANLTEGKPGIPLQLRVTVLDAKTCAPINKAAVDLWHCDARGYYSGYTANNPDQDMAGPGSGGPPGQRPRGEPADMGAGAMGMRGEGMGSEGMGAGGSGNGPDPQGGAMFTPTDQETFFRGIQFTDAKGVAEFTTIYPGWYYGRAIHIHMKVHIGASTAKQLLSGGHVSHIGQVGFPDDINDRLAQHAAYADRKLIRTRNDQDSIFSRDAEQYMVKLTPRSKDMAMGFVADTIVVVDQSALPSAASMGGGPRG